MRSVHYSAFERPHGRALAQCQSVKRGEGAGRQVARRDAVCGPLTTVLFVVKETRHTNDTLVISTMLNGYSRRVARARVAVPFSLCARIGLLFSSTDRTVHIAARLLNSFILAVGSGHGLASLADKARRVKSWVGRNWSAVLSLCKTQTWTK